jgi:GDPmannose 4,6-dehydratase
MWLMLQQNQPDDYVIATGTAHSIRDVLDVAFARTGVGDWSAYVTQDKRFFRPIDVDHLVGDPSKAREVLTWRERVAFRELIEMMVDADIQLERRLAAQVP